MDSSSDTIARAFAKHGKAIGRDMEASVSRTGKTERNHVVVISEDNVPPVVMTRRELAKIMAKAIGTSVEFPVTPPGHIAVAVFEQGADPTAVAKLCMMRLSSDAELANARRPKDDEVAVRTNTSRLSLESLDLAALAKAEELDEESFCADTDGQPGFPARVCYLIARLSDFDVLIRSAHPEERARGIHYVSVRRGRGDLELLRKQFTVPDLLVERELRAVNNAYEAALANG